MNKKKKNRKRFIIFLFVVGLLGIILYFFINISLNENSKKINTIKGYDYILEKRDTDLMKDNFESLKKILSNEKINYKKYAEYISKLFIIDLYTLNNKNSKYDVGGTEYIYPDNQEMYEQKVQDTLYNYLNPSKKLPEVISITLDDIQETTYDYEKITYDGFQLKLSWKYTKKNNYDNTATVTVININDKLYIANITPGADL